MCKTIDAENERDSIEKDLIKNYNPVCNDQLTEYIITAANKEYNNNAHICNSNGLTLKQKIAKECNLANADQIIMTKDY